MENDEWNKDFNNLVVKTIAEKQILIYGTWAGIATSLFFAYLLGKKRGAKNVFRYPFA